MGQNVFIDIDMIKNDHTKAFATEYTELVPYAREHKDTISWFDGMVTGNGENGAVIAGSPYSDSIIYNNINFWHLNCNCIIFFATFSIFFGNFKKRF